MNSNAQKIVVAGAVALAGLVAGKVLEKGWKAVTGHAAPVDFSDDQTTISEFVIYAAVSGALLALARAATQSQTQKMFAQVPKA
ncbi:Protein of unknown function [Ruaniaceae bacterium KH17]|nr:Protein of unknown function [Ruaniaceae bacterium KH17]